MTPLQIVFTLIAIPAGLLAVGAIVHVIRILRGSL